MTIPVTGQYVSTGELDRLISIISVTNALNELGEPVPTETVTQTMWAKRASFVARDFTRMQTTGVIADVMYQVRYRDGIAAGMRVREDTTDYIIISVEEIGRRKGLAITCKVAQ